jgi:hypothetical protein
MATLQYRENPRMLAVVPPQNIGKTSLILESDLDSTCVVKFTNQKQAGLVPFTHRPVHGCIGIVSVNAGII